MNLFLQRRPSADDATIGEIFVDGVHECFSCEDVVRVAKVPGETAIPAGRYRVTITQSARFGRLMPLINDVPGFDGIRIHTGNTSADTEGCILVGQNAGTSTVAASKLAFDALYPKIEAALQDGGECWITIHNG